VAAPTASRPACLHLGVFANSVLRVPGLAGVHAELPWQLCCSRVKDLPEKPPVQKGAQRTNFHQANARKSTGCCQGSQRSLRTSAQTLPHRCWTALPSQAERRATA